MYRTVARLYRRPAGRWIETEMDTVKNFQDAVNSGAHLTGVPADLPERECFTMW